MKENKKGFVIYFTGQPEHGKTTLAYLMKSFMPEAFVIDGDDLRDLTVNKDYSETGRRNNMKLAQNISKYLFNQGHYAIVSLINPYKDLREEFKAQLNKNVLEVYVHTDQPKERDKYRVENYQAPSDNFLSLDTGKTSPIDCVKLIINQIEKQIDGK